MHQEKLLFIGGCLLAFGAAFVNTALLMQTGTSVSHLTGDISKLAADLSSWTPEMLEEAICVTIAAGGFFMGALLAGFFIHHPSLDFTRPYGRTITGIGGLLVLSASFDQTAPQLSIAAASIGCGLQNALANHYRGIVLRTTHLTGMFTDFGVTAGMRLRGHQIPMWKIIVPLTIILAFFAGGITAGILHAHQLNTIAIASAAYLAAGMSWSVLKRALLKVES